MIAQARDSIIRHRSRRSTTVLRFSIVVASVLEKNILKRRELIHSYYRCDTRSTRHLLQSRTTATRAGRTTKASSFLPFTNYFFQRLSKKAYRKALSTTSRKSLNMLSCNRHTYYFPHSTVRFPLLILTANSYFKNPNKIMRSRLFSILLLAAVIILGDAVEVEDEELPHVSRYPNKHRRTHANLPRFSQKEIGKGKGMGASDSYVEDHYYYDKEGKSDKKSKDSKKEKKDGKKEKKEKSYGEISSSKPTQRQTRTPTIKPTSSEAHLPTPIPTSINNGDSESEDMHPTTGNSEDCPRKYFLKQRSELPKLVWFIPLINLCF